MYGTDVDLVDYTNTVYETGGLSKSEKSKTETNIG